MKFWFGIVFWSIVVCIYAYIGVYAVFLSVPGSGSFPFGALIQVLICFGMPAVISLIYIIRKKPVVGFIWLVAAIPLFIACVIIYIQIFEK